MLNQGTTCPGRWRSVGVRGECVLLLAAAAILSSSCTPLPVSEATGVAEHRHATDTQKAPHSVLPLDHLVIVVIDGVRWQEVFLGVEPRRSSPGVMNQYRTPSELMPELHRIARSRGVLIGGDESKVRVSSGSTVSLPGYAELFSGRTPTCHDNECGRTEEPTLLDTWRGSEPDASMAIVSSWSRIPRVVARDPTHLIISAGRGMSQNTQEEMRDPKFHAAVTLGRDANPAPGGDDYRPDRFTAAVGLRLLELRSPRFLFLGLGDTDELAHQGDYAAYLRAMRDADTVIGRIDAWLAVQREGGKRTLLIVTTDHGRAEDFLQHGGAVEASRIWMLWSGNSVIARGYPAARDSRLADLAATLRPWLGLSPDQDERAGRTLSVLRGQPAGESSFTVGGLVAAKP